MTPPEFSRPQRIDTIGAGESTVGVTAHADERAALARRFDLIAIDALSANYRLHREGADIRASGELSAVVVQSCVATRAPLRARIEETFELRFVPEEGASEAEEIELEPDDCDTMFYAGAAIDLGEAAAETLLLALDPFPRAPGAEAVLKDAGVITEDEVRPAGALGGLRDLLKRGS